MKKVINIKETALGKIEYSVEGNGKPVLFLHGGHSNCREFLIHKGFDVNHFQLITPSRPGYGNTPLQEDSTPKNAADLMMALLDALHIEKAMVYAVSAAGPTAISMTASYPKRIEKLILASAVTMKWLNKSESTYKLAQLLFHPNFERFIWGAMRLLSKVMPYVIAKSFYAQFSLNEPHNLLKGDVEELLATFEHYRSKKGFLCDIDHCVSSTLFSHIFVPTLIIHSANDNSVPFDHALHAYELIEASKLVKLENEWGHLFWIGHDAQDSIKKTLEFIG